MGKSRYIFGFLLFGMVSLLAETNRYDVKSAIIEYEIVGAGDIMGSKATVTGSSKLYFKDFGKMELNEEKIVQAVDGDKEEEHNITKIAGNKIFNVDFFIQIGEKFIGLQIKPVNSGIQLPEIFKEYGLQAETHKKFTEVFGGKVFYDDLE